MVAKRPTGAAAPTASSGQAAPTASSRQSACSSALRERPTLAQDVKDALHQKYIVRMYQILGRGADGGVVRGVARRGPDAGAWHALKFVARDAYGHEQGREMETLSWLQMRPHQNIVALIDHWAPFPPERPQWVYAFPEADMDCRAFLQRHRRGMSPEMANAMAAQMLSGIVHLHEVCSIVHRDIKPDNTLVHFMPADLAAAPGGLTMDICLKITDFSRARFVPPFPQRRITRKRPMPATTAMMSTGVCSMNYCAPELLWHGRAGPESEDQVCCDTSIDVWPFGRTCFELHTGMCFADGPTLTTIASELQLRLGSWPEELVPDDLLDNGIRAMVSPAWEIDSRIEDSALVQRHPWLAHSLRWLPRERKTAQCLARMCPTSSIAGSSPSSRVALGPAALAASQGPSASPPLEVHSALPAIVSPVVTPKPQMLDMKCRCSGNCGHGHRRGCPCLQVLPGSRLCVKCTCAAPGCSRPAHRSRHCVMHGRIYESMPWPLQISARMGGPLAQMMLPVDVVDFLQHARQVKGDLASVITLAVFKEPASTAAFMKTCQGRMSDPEVTPEDVAADLMTLLHTVEQKDSEMEVLGAQGVARVTGLASTCRAYFRIIGKVHRSSPKEKGVKRAQKKVKQNPSLKADRNASQKDLGHGRGQGPAASQDLSPSIVLGKTRIVYEATHEVAAVARFLRAYRRQQESWQRLWELKDVAQVAQAVGTMTAAMNKDAKAFPNSVGYVRKFIDRKLLLLVVAAGATDPHGWSATPAKIVTNMLPDQHAFASEVPEDWTAADLSRFLFDRDDWAAFVSMWTCLWNDLHNKYGDRLEQIEGFLDGGLDSQFAAVARALATKTGHNCTPCAIVDQLMEETVSALSLDPMVCQAGRRGCDDLAASQGLGSCI